MDEPITEAGRILSLSERGYSSPEIALEMLIPLRRVNAVLRKANQHSADSRRLFEVHEAVLEILGIARQLLTHRQAMMAQQHKRAAERALPKKLGAAIERATKP